MAAISATASGYAATSASTLSSSTTNLYWGSKGCTLLICVRKSSCELFPLRFESAVQIVHIVCCTGLLLVQFSSGAITILLVFALGSSLGFTVIFVRIIT